MRYKTAIDPEGSERVYGENDAVSGPSWTMQRLYLIGRQHITARGNPFTAIKTPEPCGRIPPFGLCNIFRRLPRWGLSDLYKVPTRIIAIYFTPPPLPRLQASGISAKQSIGIGHLRKVIQQGLGKGFVCDMRNFVDHKHVWRKP